ncbi:hypothetical protein N658DRAFT_388597, partial [Parathielavia hyrcaniae]
ASQAEVVGSAAVHYIERREAGGSSNEKPFNAGQKGATMAKYSTVWASVMAYIWRTWHFEPVEEPRVRASAYAATGGRDGGETGSETGSKTGSEMGGADKDDTSELEGHVLDFFIELLDHDIGDNEYQNALYSGLAVLGIQTGHGWRSALVYTPVLSAVVTVARMLVLYKAKRAREDEIRR